MNENGNDKRLIEDYLPIEAISAEASGEPRTKGHISTLHLWRARRPLVACRAAVYGALVSASRFVPENGADDKKKSLGRANSARFVKSLCQYPGEQRTIQEAQRHILTAHADRLTAELSDWKAERIEKPGWVDEFKWKGEKVTVEDIVAGRAPRPRVLDMFAGGGAIPLESARLGCETHAVDLNPVAHLIELCTIKYPQQFGTSIADDVEKWGRIVLDATRESVSDLSAVIASRKSNGDKQMVHSSFGKESAGDALSVVAYYWTRTAPCPNPTCRATVPLYRQTWLRRKDSGYVALKPLPDLETKVMGYRVVESSSEAGLGFDPTEGSKGSSTVCPFCAATLKGDYVRQYGETTGFGQQLMCIIALNPEGTGKVFISDATLAHGEEERQARAEVRAHQIEQELGNSSLDELVPPTGNAGLATGNSYLYGINTFRQMFTPRQRCTLLSMAREIHRAHKSILADGAAPERAKAITTYLGLWLSRLTDKCNTLARWNNGRETIEGLTSMKRFAMMWDYPEVNLFGGGSGDAWGSLVYITAAIRREGAHRNPATTLRASAANLPHSRRLFDAVITDPPYYDNESYSELSDVCYVWIRPTLTFLYPEHLAGKLTPKKEECVAAAYRQGGRAAAKEFYENTLFNSLLEAHRVTKDGGILVMVYAHKTTLGWSTLVEAIRRAGYEVTEAWPLDTEAKGRVAHRGDSALASSIFLVARKRDATSKVGNYEVDVVPELESIVRERVETLWEMGISGADLVIACVGAGLRAFTKYARVEFANGEEVPAERFLMEVETVVLEAILGKLSKTVGAKAGQTLSGLDTATRFYVLWRYTYGGAELDAGEAIIFANGTHVELDGQHSLTAGARALLEKKKGKYKLLDFTERGDDHNLGLPAEDGTPAPAVDALHRLMWLVEHKPPKIPDFLNEAKPNVEQLRLVAQALAGPALKGGELADVSPTAEQSALGKLLANWNAVMVGKAAIEDKRAGQQQLL